MKPDLFTRNISKTKCWSIALATCLLLCSPRCVNALFSNGGGSGNGYVTYGGHYIDAVGSHIASTSYPYSQPTVSAGFGGSGVYESPLGLGDHVTYAIGGAGYFSPGVVGFGITQFSLSLSGGVVKPTPTTSSFSDGTTAVVGGTFGGTNNYFPDQAEVDNEKIFGYYSVGLSGTVPAGESVSISLNADAYFVSLPHEMDYTFHEGPFSIHFADRSPDYRSAFYDHVQGSVSISMTVTHDETSDFQIDDPGNVVISGSAAGGLSPSLPYPPGDYNRNGVVDAGDYVIWRRGDIAADGNYDGIVDRNDYDLWRANYGQSISGSGSSIERTSVPEPSARLLLGVASISLLRYRKAKW